MPPSVRMAGTVATRPGPRAIQSANTTEGSFSPESGSSGGHQTSDSFVLLPRGAQVPNPPPQLDFPLIATSNAPPQRRLSRLTQQQKQKALPPVPVQQLTPDEKQVPKIDQSRTPQPPSSWAVHFRGFVKAVRWSKSSPQLASIGKGKNTSCETPKDSPPNLAAGPQRPFSRAATSSRASGYKRPDNSPNISANGGGVFMVPHMSNTDSELRPPTPGWKNHVPVDPYDIPTARTILGHGSTGSEIQTSSIRIYTPTSPPRADFPVRKSVSEIGHGSIAYAQLSPDASMSSFEHHFHYDLNSPDPSQENFPHASVEATHGNTKEEEKPPVPPKGRLDGFKRAFSFSRRSENKSTSDLPAPPTSDHISYHRSAKSADATGLALESPSIDNKGRARLRRRSTMAGGPRTSSPSSYRPPKFMLSPDASGSSILSTSTTPALPSPTPSKVVAPPPTRRRLTKRKPSVKTNTQLPTTLEVETPKSGEIPNPMDALLPAQFLPYTIHTTIVPTPDTPELPLSAPPTTSFTVSITKALPEVPEAPSVLPPAPPLLPSPLHHPPPRRSSLRVEAFPNPNPGVVDRSLFPKLHIPPSAMKNIRPHLPHRPSLERRASRRRWTLDIASEEIDEEVLKQELERLRLLGQPAQGINPPDENWTHARKVLLSSREVILTERTYLTQLTRFLDDVTSDSNVPPLLIQQLPLLIAASQAFCSRLTEDPSAWGVSAAFITVESMLEQTLVEYCQVVGTIMLECQQQASSSKSSPHSGSRSSMSKSRSSIVNGATSEFGKMFSSSNRSTEKVGEEKKPTGISQGDGVRNVGRGVGVESVFPRSRSMPGKKLTHRVSLPANASGATTSFGTAGMDVPSGTSPTEKRGGNLSNGKMKANSAADIAISPPQRVTRYVLLYREILQGTPLTAASRPLVQRALDGAVRIAENCDKAQGSLPLIKRKP